MTCDVKVRAANGNPSILYNELLHHTKNADEAHRLYLLTKREEFTNWFGDSFIVDANREPGIQMVNDQFVYENAQGKYKSVNNKGTYGKQYVANDVIDYLAGLKVVASKKYDNANWVLKGQTVDGANLLDSNIRKIDKFNQYYYDRYGTPLVYVHKERTSAKVEVNELLLSNLNNRNQNDIYFSEVADNIADMDAMYLNTEDTSSTSMSYVEEKYGINVMSSMAIKLKDDLTKLTFKNAVEGQTVRSILADNLIAYSKQRLDLGLLTTKQHNVNVNTANNALNNDLFWNKVKFDIQYGSGFIITELNEVEVDDQGITNSFDENMQFKVSPDKRVDTLIKELINTTPILKNGFTIQSGNKVHQIDRNTAGGLSNTMRFYDVSNYLVQLISKSNSVSHMLELLEIISNKVNPSYSTIVTKLKNDENLANLFFRSFKNESPSRITLTLNPESKKANKKLTVDQINKSSYLYYQIANNWINTLKMYKSSNFYASTGTLPDIRKTYKLLQKAVGSKKIDALEKFFKLTGVNITRNTIESVISDSANRNVKVPANVKNAEQYISDKVIDNVFGLVVQDVLTYVTFTGDLKKLDDIKILGNMLRLADQIQLFYNPINNTYINVTGNQEQTFNKPTYIGEWFDMAENNEDMLLEYFRTMYLDSKVRTSNWLNHFITIPDGNPNLMALNKDTLANFKLEFFDGLKYIPTNATSRYTDIVDKDWNYTSIATYFSSDIGYARYFLLSPADRGNTRMITAPRYGISNADVSRGRLNTKSSLYNAILNVFNGELNRITKEYEEVFDIEGNVVANIEDLYVGYHYTLDDNNNPIFEDKDGNLTGEAFKFQHFDFIDNHGATQTMNGKFDGVPHNSLMSDEVTYSKVHSHIGRMITRMTNEQIDLNRNNRNQITNDITTHTGLSYEAAILDYTMNRYVAHVEMMNFFMGDPAFYGNSTAANKRATELLASGVTNGHYGTYESFTAITSFDRIITNDKFISNMEAELNKQGYSEDIVRFVVDSYKNIETTDAQSYITYPEFKRRMKAFGLEDKYSDLINRIEDETKEITIEDLNEFANALKNFYYAYEFDGKRYVPTQVKNSEQVIIPRFFKNTELGVLHQYMVDNFVDQVNFVSAEKVGTRYITDISDKDGNLSIDVEDFNKAINTYYYKNLRKQQDSINHIVDSTNKLGIQIAKKILDNVSNETTVQELLNLYVANVEESAKGLIKEFGITKDDNGDYIVNKDKLSQILIKSGISRSITNNALKGFELDEHGEFKLPLDHITNRISNESMINSIFSNRVINQKFPGIHGPQMSNAFMRKIEDGKVVKDSDLTYSQFESVNGESRFVKAQVKLPYWSKAFFGDETVVTIEKLKEAGLDTMVGYRIPTEDKHSMFVFEVIEFLSPAQGSTIVVPDEFIPQTGADFDFDTIYTMLFNFKVDKQGNVHKINYTTDDEHLTDRYINYVNSNYVKNVKPEVTEELKLKAERSYSSYKARRKRLSNERNEAAKEELDNILEYVNATKSNIFINDITSQLELLNSDGLNTEEAITMLNFYVEERIGFIEHEIAARKKENSTYTNLYGLIDKFRLLNLYTQDSASYLTGLTDNVQEYNDSIKQKMQDRYWSTFSLEVAKGTALILELDTVDEFSNKPIVEQNTKEARDNRILELYIEVLSDPANYLEVATPNNFEDIKDAKKAVEAGSGRIDNTVNFANPTTQDGYRTKALAGRKLKGFSVNRDSFISIAQRIGLNLKYPVIYQFDVNKYGLDKLYETFGEENVQEDGTVELTKFANNHAGTFTNVEGKLITSYVAQSTANILDSVKFPLPLNVNDHTFNIWRVIPELGGTWTSSTLLISQEAINRVIDNSNENDSIHKGRGNNPIRKTKYDILKEIVLLNLDNELITNIEGQEKETAKIRDKATGYVSTRFLDEVYDIISKDNVVLSDKLLTNALKNHSVKLEGNAATKYLTTQLAILSKYEQLSEIADQISDFQLATSFDKRRVGPEFADNNSIYDHFDKILNRVKYDIAGNIVNKSKKSYENILLTEDGGHYYHAIYTNPNSKYAPLKSYFNNGIRLADQVFSNQFITGSIPFGNLLSTIPNDHRKPMTSYTIAMNLSNLRFFNETGVNKLLGANGLLEELDITELNDENVAKFKELSVANKLLLVKNHYREFINEGNVLHYLNPMIDPSYYENNNRQGINFILDSHTDDLTSSFLRMWYNRNPYFHLLAQDLVKYAYFNNGLNFGRNISKIIPTEVLHKDPVVLDTINGVDILQGIGYTAHLDKQRLAHFDNNSGIDYDLFHKIKFARTSTGIPNVVPKLTPTGIYKHTRFIPNRTTGIVTVTKAEFYKLDMKVQRANVVVRWKNTGSNTSPVFTPNYYAKIPVTNRKSGMKTFNTTYYYVPVNKLEQYEYNDNSRIEENNVHKPIDHYIGILQRNLQNTILDENTNELFDSANIEPNEAFSEVSAIDDNSTDFTEYNASAIKHLQNITADYNLRIRQFPSNKLLSHTTDRLNKIDYGKNLDAGVAAGIRADSDYAARTVKALEKALYSEDGYLNKATIKEATKDPNKRVEFTTFMNYANTFLKGLSRMNDLQKIRKDNLTAEEEEINRAISSLTRLAARVNELKATHNTIMNTYFENLLNPISSNPAIKLGFRNMFDVQDDESKIQLFLDALIDTNHSFVANFIKRLYVDNGISDDEIATYQAIFKAKIEEFKKDGLNIEDLVTKDNKLIQEFDEAYKTDLEDMTVAKSEAEEKYGRYRKQYYEAEKKLNKWKLDNLSSEESKELEQDKFDANDILFRNMKAREAYEALKDKRRAILSNYDGVVDYGVMTKADISTLYHIKMDIEFLASEYDNKGNKKSAEDIAIAKSVTEYREAHGKIFDKYFEPVIAITEYANLLNKFKNSNTPEARTWLANNTKIEVKEDFWDTFKKHRETLGKESTRTDIMALLKAYRDTNGVVNGLYVSDELRDKIKKEDEGRVDEVDSKNPKAIDKPKNDEHYNDKYYARYDNRGEDSRDTDEDILAYKEAITDILFSYIGDNGLLNTTAISVDDMNNIIELELKIKEASITYTVDIERDAFNAWFNENHDSILDKDAFNDAEEKAGRISPEYLAKWRDLNTELRLDKKWYKTREVLAKKYNLRKKSVKNDDKDQSERVGTNVNIDFVRQFYKVDDINDLPDNIKDLIKSKTHYNIYDSLDPIYSLSDYLKPHKIMKTGKNNRNMKRRFNNNPTVEENYIEAAQYVEVLYKSRKIRETSWADTAKKPLLYRDAMYELTDFIPTDEYKALLEKHGKNSKWYLDNHIINFRGEVTPAHYWVKERPKDKALYEENAPTRKYWGYNTVTEKAYVDKAKTEAKTWTNNNVNYTHTAYYEKAKADMQARLTNGEITQEAYNTWFNDNHYYNPYTNKYDPISIWTTMTPSDAYVNKYAPLEYAIDQELKKEYINKNPRAINNKPLPLESSKYYNKEFEKAKDNPLYAYINETMLDLVSHYQKDTIIDENQLPIMYQDSTDRRELASKILRRIGWYSYASREVVGENNDGVRILNMPMVSDIVKEGNETIDLPKEAEFNTRQEYLERYNEIVKQNKEITAVNKQFTLDHMSKNWEEVITAFIQAAKKHKFKYEKEHEMKLALEEIRNLDLAKKRTTLARLRNLTKSKLAKEKPGLYRDDTGIATTKGINSNLEEHFRAFTDMIFYGEFEKDEGNWTKFSRVLQNFTSAKGMWLNTPGAFNNIAYGRTQMAMEHWSEYYYGKKDMLIADKMYVGGMFHMIAELNKDTTTNYASALIKKFSILKLQDELAATNNEELNTQMSAKLMSTNSLYFMHHIGEHYMQNTALLAMLQSNRLVGGTIMSLPEYTYDLQYKALLSVLDVESKHELDKFIRDNKNQDRYLDGRADILREFILSKRGTISKNFLKTLKELKENAEKKFKTYEQLMNIYELKDGVASVKDGHTITDEQFQLFKLKVIKVNQKVHGIYNKFDAGTIQRYAIGRLAVQFKKWLRPGFIKRFGSRVGKSHWNEARNELDKGMYVSTFQFLTRPIGDAFRDAKGEEAMALKAFGSIFSNYANYISNIGLYWHTLTDTDKANIRRTLAETLQFVMVMGIMWILKGLADGDEDDKKWAYLLYVVDRVGTELLAYNPAYGFTNETRKLLRDPFAAMAAIEDALKLVYVATFENEKYYKGGVYHGERKLEVQFKKNIPLLNRRLRYDNIQDYAGYYKLY